MKSSAKRFYQQALKLDKQHKKAAQALDQVNQAITEQDFRRAMSQGFSALEENRFAQANAAFAQASKIYPQNQAVAQALSQLETQQSQLLVSEQMQQAAEFEQQEQWQQQRAKSKSGTIPFQRPFRHSHPGSSTIGPSRPKAERWP